MNEKTLPYRFYSASHIPDKLHTMDVLHWVAASLVPEASYQDGSVEGREDPEVLTESPLEFGTQFQPMWFEKSETDCLEIFEDPRMAHFEADESAFRYSLNTTSLQSVIGWDFEGSEDDDVQRQKLEAATLLPIASGYEELLQIWEQNLDDALDQYRVDLLSYLRRGELTGEGILFQVSASEDVQEEVYEALYHRRNNSIRSSDLYVPIPKELWLTRTLDWEGSYIRDRTDMYVGIRFSSIEIFKKFPPKNAAPLTAHEFGQSIVIYDDKTQKPSLGPKRGRPRKNWDAVAVKIAEILQENGQLPGKQDALAHEICDWYLQTFGEPIGLSTVHSKLSQYYRSPIIQNS